MAGWRVNILKKKTQGNKPLRQLELVANMGESRQSLKSKGLRFCSEIGMSTIMNRTTFLMRNQKDNDVRGD